MCAKLVCGGVIAFYILCQVSAAEWTVNRRNAGHEAQNDGTAILYTPNGGVAVSSALVRDHVPTAPQGILQSLLFEHMTDGLLVSHDLSIDVRQVAPHVHVPDVSNTRVVVDRVLRATAPRGPTMRFGENHTFVYDYQSNALLTAWGPGLHLRPLHLELHPNVFVNLRHDASLKKLHLEHIPPSSSPNTSRHAHDAPYTYRDENAHLHNKRVRDSGRSKGSVSSEKLLQWRTAQLNYRPNFTSESEIFFDVAFAFDAPFCKRFGTHDNVSQVVHAAAVAARKMALEPIVSVRIGDIIGACDETMDDFQRPASALNCPADSQTCSRPGLILEAFQKAWPGGGIADATYLLSGLGEGSDVVGAAWVAAVCNPDYGFGWIEGDYPVIIAHEIAHSLGAKHSATGLMMSALDLDKRAELARGSLEQIQAYLRKIAPLNCLQPRHNSTSQNRRRYSAFTRLTMSNVTMGTDIVALPTKERGAVIVVMLEALYNAEYGDQLAFSFATVRRNHRNKEFPFGVTNEVEPTSFVAQNISLSHRAGGGLAVAKIIDRVFTDAVVVYLEAGRFTYVIGHKLEREKGVLGGWVVVPQVPINVGPSVRCLGATISSLSGNSTNVTNDMVIAYVDKRGEISRAYYIVGLDIVGPDGKAKKWMSPQALDWNTTNEIGDIGVDMIDTTKSGRPDLVFSYTERINGLWAHRITVGYDIDVLGRPTQTWKSIAPDLTYSPTSEVEKITGGIALANMGSSRPTAIIYQGREISTGNTQWLEVGDDILAEEPGDVPPIITAVDGMTPLETCRDCYLSGTDLAQCEQRIRECFAKRPPDIYELSNGKQLVYSGFDAQRGVQTIRVGLIPKPSVQKIVCSGFHELFLVPSAGCRSDVQDIDIVRAGVTSALKEDIVSVEKSGNITQTVVEVNDEIMYGEAPENLRYLSPSATSGSARVPKTVNVYIGTPNPPRQQIITAATQKLKKRKDYNDLFSHAKIHIEKKGRYQYKVILGFANKFQKSYLEKMPLS